MARRTVFFLLLLTALTNGVIRQSFKNQWTVTGGTDEILTLNATVPGGIFSDLMNSGKIGVIFYGTGDTNYNWVGLNNWTYSSKFTVDEELLANRVVLLVFEGIDTFATIFINGEQVGTSENMFVRYNFNIKEQLKVGDNEITVEFISAVTKAQTLAKEPNNTYVIAPDCPGPDYKGICYANLLRKMQASFSWDWGPAFASVGIWKDVYLVGFNDAIIDYIVATPLKNPDDNLWTVSVTTTLNVGEITTISGSIDISLPLNDIAKSSSIRVNQSVDEFIIEITHYVTVDDKDVSLWWPNGYGSQPLYNLSVTFTGEHEQDEKSVQIGFRTVELVQEELDQGLSFYFKVNQIPIFAKGSNEIPLNILPEKGQDPVVITKILESAKSVNMNMLRVWGGGVYESDTFYELADKYGIMIWQDFMFACALYPTNDDYLKNVVKEVRHQVKRLASHPSIAIWSGNNENEIIIAAFYNWDLYRNDYVKLYVDVIQQELEQIIPNVTYITSSPTNGVESDKEGHVAANPNDSLFGDVHVYNYINDSWSPDIFPISRFASEYGYQSMPSTESWLTATDNLDDLRPDSAFMDYRQRHPYGNIENINLINIQMQLPDPKSENYVQAFIYFSQILQAQSVKAETEHYRSFKGRVDELGQGNTMGALYWQLNDVWVGPTWSGIDFTGRWKMLQYYTKDFFSPMIVTGRLTDENLEVYALYDGLELPNVTVKSVVHIYKWESLQPLVSVEFPVSLDLLKSVLVTTMHAPTALQTAGCGSDYTEAKTKCFFHLHLLDQDNNDLAPFNYVFPEKLKNCNLANATIKIDSVTAPDETGINYEIVVSTDAVGLFVWLDSHEIKGRFSENGFLQVDLSKTVKFTAESSVTLDELKSVLTVTHLRDSAYL